MTRSALRTSRALIAAHAVIHGTADAAEAFRCSDQTVRNACRENGVRPKAQRRAGRYTRRAA